MELRRTNRLVLGHTPVASRTWTYKRRMIDVDIGVAPVFALRVFRIVAIVSTSRLPSRLFYNVESSMLTFVMATVARTCCFCVSDVYEAVISTMRTMLSSLRLFVRGSNSTLHCVASFSTSFSQPRLKARLIRLALILGL